MDYKLDIYNNMATDFSKYGTPVETGKFYGSIDVAKYGTPATPTPMPVAKKTTLGSKIKSGLKSELKKSYIFGSGKAPSIKEQIDYGMSAVAGFTGGGALKNIAQKAKTLSALKNTTETLSKFEENTASLAGRIKSRLGKKIVLPSETEKRAAEMLEGKIKSITKNPAIIKGEIAKKGAEVESYLVKNKLPITAQEQAEMFSKARQSMEKYATKTELKAYDEQMRTFLKQLPGRGGYTTDNFYKALKEFEENVTMNLKKGKTALIGDSQGIGSARIRAAQDIRKVVRDMIGQKHPEFKGKMFDLASLYDVLDTALAKSRQFDVSKARTFLTGALKTGGAVAGTYLLGKKLLGGGSNQSFSSINTIGNE